LKDQFGIRNPELIDMSEFGYSLSKYSNSDITILLTFVKNNTAVVFKLIKNQKITHGHY